MSVESECLLAATGFISPEVTEARITQAAEMPDRITKRVHRWLTTNARHTWTPTKSQNTERLRDRLGITLDAIPGQELLPEVLAAELVLEVNDARQSLLAKWPALHLTGGLDGSEPPLAFDRAQDWLSCVRCVEDLESFLTELELGCALPEHVFMVKEVYPDLSNLITEAMFNAIVEMSAAGRDMTPGKDRSARLWLELKEEVPLVEAKKPAKESPAPGAPSSKAPEALKTESQKAGM